MVDKDKLYELISAIQKAIRWCEINDARYFARELIDMGVPDSVWGQLRIIAAEDIGLADPTMVGYVEECYDDYNKVIEDEYNKIKPKDVKKIQKLCDIIDRVVIAEAISYKSRILPMANFITLYNIYKHENFKKSKTEFSKKFINSLGENDLKKIDIEQALYNAFIGDIIFGERKKILRLIQEIGEKRNGDLVKEWIEAYERKGNLLTLTGSVILACKEKEFTHGEYKDSISQYLNKPIKSAIIPDRAYDKHTRKGQIKGRGLKFFFDVSGTVKNEKFPNKYEDEGKKSYYEADKIGLADEKLLIRAIKEKYNAPSKFMTF